MRFTSLNVLLPNEKFSGKTQGVKGRETGWGRKQGGKEKKRELPLNCGSAESDRIYEASASSRTLRLTPRQGCTIQLPRLCTAQLQRIHSQRQQRWFCRGSRLAPTQMVWESGGLASAHNIFSPRFLVSKQGFTVLTLLISQYLKEDSQFVNCCDKKRESR